MPVSLAFRDACKGNEQIPFENLDAPVLRIRNELGEKVASDAGVDPKTDHAGVIESSATSPESRRRGMNAAVRTACVEYLSGKGKVALGITKDINVVVHRVIEKLDGSLTDPWLSVRLRKSPPLMGRILPLRLRRCASSTRDRVLRH